MAEDDDNVISEVPEYSPKSEFSKARICERQSDLCAVARSNEMKEGYYNTKFTKEGIPLKVWVADAREKFFGSVHALLSLLSPEISRDKRAKQHVEIFDEALEEIKQKYIYEELELYENQGILKYRKTGRKYMPQIDAKVIVEILDPRTHRLTGQEVIGGWNTKVNAYKNELVEVYDWMFAKLNDLIDRNNYFKASAQF